jgi:hypothetical protein
MRRLLTTLGLGVGLLVTLAPGEASAEEEFSYLPAGDLTPGSGSGRADETVYAPGMRFPIEDGPAYPNSQVWGHGGGSGPGGGQCDVENFSYPWRDNYCESRSWDMPLCPSGTGHQGQDIRGATCDDLTHWIVASEAGTVTNVGSYSVYVTTASGQRFDYLHGRNLQISSGQAVEKGQRIGQVSNNFGGTPTTIHLHFNIKQDVAGVGFVYVSPYMSLVESYQELMGLTSGEPPAGPVESVTCEAIQGWAQDADQPDAPVEVRVYFGGDQDDPDAIGVTIPADEYRDDLCDDLGSCEHGFTLEVPASLRDGQPHPVFLYGVDDQGDATAQLGTGPSEIQCGMPSVPDGVRRRISGPEAMADWELSPFWDALPADDAMLDDIPEGIGWPDRRDVVRVEGDADLWMVDQGLRRLVTPDVAEVWGIDASEVEIVSTADLEALEEGPALQADKFVLSADGVTLYVLDDLVCDTDDCDHAAGSGTTGGDGSGGDGSGTDGAGGDGPAALPDYAGDDDQGCGCRSVRPTRKSLLWGLLLLWGWRRRRAA